MSNYCWEKGTIIIPRASWVYVRNVFIEEQNRRMELALATAKKLYPLVLEAKKKAARGKFNVKSVVWELLHYGDVSESTLKPGTLPHYREDRQIGSGHLPKDFKDDAHIIWSIERSMTVLTKDERGWTKECVGKVRAPLRKDFPLLAKTKDCQIVSTDATLAIRNEACELTWDVSENNHAVESARASWLGRLLFQTLDGVKWTRGTGGEIYGNDEYNGDSEGSGAGANYTTACYGPLGEQAVEFSLQCKGIDVKSEFGKALLKSKLAQSRAQR